jgi:hypothetical protein
MSGYVNTTICPQKDGSVNTRPVDLQIDGGKQQAIDVGYEVLEPLGLPPPAENEQFEDA